MPQAYEAIIDHGCDWLSITCDDERTAHRWNGLYTRVKTELLGTGIRVRPGELFGYVGEWQDHWFVGRREDGWLSRQSGEIAREYWWPIARVGGQASRIDLQITYKIAGPVGAFMEGLARDIEFAEAHRPHKCKIVTLSSGGQVETIYIGSRSSGWYGRIYDKHKESKDDTYRQGVRFEIEVKGNAAQDVLNALRARGGDDGIPRAIVRDYFRSHGASCPAGDDQSVLIVQTPRGPTPTERQLAWLATQVAPTVARLINDCGYWRVIDALLCKRLDSRDERAILEEIARALGVESHDEYTGNEVLPMFSRPVSMSRLS